MRLTDLAIQRLKLPAQGQQTHYDDAVPGFGVRVSQGGTKSFVVVYGEKRKRQTLGRYPAVRLADARKEAKRILATADINTLASMPSVTFAVARDRFLQDAESRTRERTIDEYRRHLNKHFPLDKRLTEVTRRDVMRVVERLGKTPSEQKHAFVAIRTMMNWCVKQGLLEHSPVPKLTFKAESRARYLSDEELKAVWKRAGVVGYPYGNIVQLLILTGQRRGEIANLRWEWINGDLITFPAWITKNGREHRLPIAPVTQAVLASVPRTENCDLLFPSRLDETKPFNGWSKCKRRFDKKLPFSDYTLHDLRRTFASNLARLGTPIHVTERILNHVSGTVSGVAAVYNRYSYEEEMREAVCAVARTGLT